MSFDLAYITSLNIEKHVGFLSKNSATSFHRLCVILQLSPVHFNKSELQYQKQSIDRCGDVSGKKQTCFSNPIKQRISIVKIDHQCLIGRGVSTMEYTQTSEHGFPFFFLHRHSALETNVAESGAASQFHSLE